MNQDKQTKRRAGRPAKSPDEGARINHGVRLKPSVAEALRMAAAAEGRTVSEEMELRLYRSFYGLHLDINPEQSEIILQTARDNSRSVEEEIINALKMRDCRVDDLLNLDVSEFAEFVRTAIKETATKLIARQAWTFTPEQYNSGDDEFDKVRSEIDSYKYALRIVQWTQLAEKYCFLLSDIIDPERRYEEDKNFKNYIDHIMHHEMNMKWMKQPGSQPENPDT